MIRSSLRRSRYDAVIVGARPAGAATALLLARYGHQVLLVDRARVGSDTLSTHALLRGGVLQLHRWGLLDAVIGAGTPAVHAARFLYPDGVEDVPVSPSPGVPALYAPRRTVLDPILVAAARRAGVEVRDRTSVTNVLLDRSRRAIGIVLAGGETVTASVVVGADGLHSFVGRALGARLLRTGRHGSAFVYTYMGGIGADAYEWAWAPGAMAGIIPTNDGVANVCVGLPADRFRAEAPAGLDRVFFSSLDRVAPSFADRVVHAERVERWRSFPGRPGHLRQAWGPGWVLVGDAGYWKDPLSLHGLTDALRDAELAANAIHAALDRRADEATAFRAYQESRDRLAIPLLEVTDRMAAYDWDTPGIRALLREQASVIRPEVGLLLGLGDSLRVDPRIEATNHGATAA
jgi:flavin-dependent dehydrogenase